MTTSLSCDALKASLACGLLGFPLTDFAADDSFAAQPFGDRVRFLGAQGCAALFVASAAGEFFSLTRDEYAALIETAVAARPEGVPVLGAAGGSTRDAIEQIRLAERAGADGILLLPPYLAEVSQDGLFAHISAICRSTSLGVIVYSRANGRVRPPTLAKLADQCPNLIALKDGVGDAEDLWTMRTALSGRLVFLNGMPTAEIYAPSYRAMGVPTYSSAVYNFAPSAAMAFFNAVQAGDAALTDEMMRAFFLPYGRIRSRQPGYAVSIVKAGVDIAGRSAGRVRPPLSSLTSEEYDELAPLIGALQTFEKASYVVIK
ncbi:5-dehydro-4-deoxyglucarate dehydratase [Bosea sp. PAMC 26642]|uniref:5-dehydro-4-deoxyglucarate dehydratase n=1 Tax=Bosea sp. (strain PAMC 26642) TaxID=1792307 RepID=UPI0007705D55|nr:5-dehydro-4-deoxyglucarate dehydratase [Bosea sp. PAMC 26642]AMJ61503.1 5-dehydro-4-deoxyglucarate dehydratase [Bosea sp. PAMC 26642]